MVGKKGRSGLKKKYNKRKVRSLLNLMRILGCAKRCEVARRLGWSWQCADKYMSYLRDNGYVHKRKNLYFITKKGFDEVI